MINRAELISQLEELRQKVSALETCFFQQSWVWSRSYEFESRLSLLIAALKRLQLRYLYLIVALERCERLGILGRI